MKARFPLSLASLLAMLAACTARPVAPAMTTPLGRPEIVIHAPKEQVRLSIITQEKGEGATLANQTENRLSFVTPSTEPVSNVSNELKPSGAPYVRATYTLAAEARGTRVLVRSETVSNYGTASERAHPLDTPARRRVEQRNLLRLQAIVEKP